MQPHGQKLSARPRWARLPLLLLGAAALLAGLWAGLSRLGAVPMALDPMAHGPLMVGGFLGTVIALERAVAAQVRWASLGPLLCGLGGAALLANRPAVGAGLFTAGSAVVLLVVVLVFVRAPQLHHGVLVLSALSWAAGNALLASGRPVFDVMGLWVVFLAGTIAAERLELTRVLPRAKGTIALFITTLTLMCVGAIGALWARDAGIRVLCLGEVGLAAWLFAFDIARRTVRHHGMARFIAVALLLGYGWLAVGGLLGLVFGHPIAGPHYDAIFHAVFVGFVFSMIFGHAPMIVPAIMGVKVPLHKRFYLHLGLLHASLALRLVGDLSGQLTLRRVGAWGNVAAIVLFLISTALAAERRRTTVRVP